MKRPLHILSLGVGVQSSCIFLKSCKGELPKLDAAIFADTGDETADVYEWLPVLQKEGEKAGIPVIVGRHGSRSLSEQCVDRINDGRRMDQPPLFTLGEDGRGVPIRRSCTVAFKIRVIERETKKLLGINKKARWPKSHAVTTWLGISMDERQRMKSSVFPWQKFWHPLIESETPMSRSACYWWVRENGYGEPPESSCWHCPYHSNKRWRHIRDSLPGDWEKAVEFDKALRSSEDGLIRVMKNPVFLHSSLVPLSDANIDTQQKSLFDDECSGVCGV